METWSEAIERAAQACIGAVAALTSADVPREALAAYVPPRRAFLRTKPAKFEALGEVWRLGTLLLGASATPGAAGTPGAAATPGASATPDAAGSLYAAGSATRSAERGRPSYQSNSREVRREIAAAALKSGYPVGTPVNYGAIPIPLNEATLAEASDDLPLGLSDGEIRVRWREGASLDGAPTLQAYLTERVALLVAAGA